MVIQWLLLWRVISNCYLNINSFWTLHLYSQRMERKCFQFYFKAFILLKKKKKLYLVLLHVHSISRHHDAQFSTDLKLHERIGQKFLHPMALHTKAYLVDLHSLLFLLLKLLPKPITMYLKYVLLSALYIKMQVALILNIVSHTLFFNFE